MLDECVRRNYNWHIRVDDDCWMITRTWLKKLLRTQEAVRKMRGKYVAMSPRIDGLNSPPVATGTIEMAGGTVDIVDILGGIFRMAPMTMMQYFRWDERQAMGFGDATQFRSFCESTDTELLRVNSVRATHGDSTNAQEDADGNWAYEHDMLQYIPLGL